MSDTTLTRPVMLVTGTSKGIGQYLADYYLNKGFIVVGCSRTPCLIKHENYVHLITDIANEDEII